MVAKVSMMAGAVVLALGLTSPVVANAVCIDEPCPPPRPSAGSGLEGRKLPGAEWRRGRLPHHGKRQSGLRVL